MSTPHDPAVDPADDPSGPAGDLTDPGAERPGPAAPLPGTPSAEPAVVPGASPQPAVTELEPDTDDAPLSEPEWFADAVPEEPWHSAPEPEQLDQPVEEPATEPAAETVADAETAPAADVEPEPVVEPAVLPEPVPVAAADELVEPPADEDLVEPPPAVEVADSSEQEPLPAAAVPGVRRGLAVPVLAAIAVVLAVAVVLLGVLVQRADGPGGKEEARRDAADAAREAARVVFSYDYRQLEKDFAAGRAVATGKFLEQYESSTTKVVSQVAPKYQAVVVADVSDAAVVSAGERSVKVLVFLDQQSTSTLTAQPKITQSRLEMTMVRKGGEWLVENVKAF